MQLNLVVAGVSACSIGPVELALESTSGQGGRSLSTRASGFLIPAAEGDAGCTTVNDVLGLPSTDTTLDMEYVTSNRPGPVDVHYTSTGGTLRVGTQVQLALPAGGGELTGERNPLNGELTAQLAIQPVDTAVEVAEGQTVPISLTVDTEPVIGRVPPGPGLTLVIAGLALIGYSLWMNPRFVTVRQRIPGARWHGLTPSDSVLTIGGSTLIALAIGAIGGL
jgi:hypothetical protein